MMDDSLVEDALITAVKAAITIPCIAGNIPATISDSIWARVTYAPGQVESVGIGVDSRERLYGVVLVGVFGPKGEGRSSAIAEAVKIMQAFKRGTPVVMSGGVITVSRAYRDVAIEEDNWYHVPVRIEFRAELER